MWKPIRKPTEFVGLNTLLTVTTAQHLYNYFSKKYHCITIKQKHNRKFLIINELRRRYHFRWFIKVSRMYHISITLSLNT